MQLGPRVPPLFRLFFHRLRRALTTIREHYFPTIRCGVSSIDRSTREGHHGCRAFEFVRTSKGSRAVRNN